MNKKIKWQEVCPSCVKYEYPAHHPDCACCRKHGVTENILCELNRMDQEHDVADFQCGAFTPKHTPQ